MRIVCHRGASHRPTWYSRAGVVAPRFRRLVVAHAAISFLLVPGVRLKSTPPYTDHVSRLALAAAKHSARTSHPVHQSAACLRSPSCSEVQ